MTFRPEYRGVLSQVDGAQTIALARSPIRTDGGAGDRKLIGRDPSVGRAATNDRQGSAGSPFFAEEIVWELAGVVFFRSSRRLCFDA